MPKEPYVLNFKKPEDSPEQIASKLNSLTSAINVEVIAGALPRDEFEKYKKNNDKIVGGYEDRIEYNIKNGRKILSDMRYNGVGLSKVSHDATLTGDGTEANPLKAVASGSGDVTGPATNTADYIPQWDGANSKILKDGIDPATLLTVSVASSTYVPYTGATTNVDLNAKSLKNLFISKTSDTTAKFTFDVSGLSTATIRTVTVPNRDVTLDKITTSTTAVGTGIVTSNGTSITFDSTPYLSVSLATSTYLPLSVATATYLPLSVATATYLPLSVATATYLPISVATATYLPLSVATATYLSLASAAATYITTGSTNTLTNKRITKRVNLTSGTGAYVANTDLFDVIHVTGQAVAITSITTSGTPVDGDMLRFSISATGTCAISLATSKFEASTIALPTTTSSTARLDLGFFWNTETSKWRIIAQA